MSAANSAPGWVSEATWELVSLTRIGTPAGFTPAYCWISDRRVETMPGMSPGVPSMLAAESVLWDG